MMWTLEKAVGNLFELRFPLVFLRITLSRLTSIKKEHLKHVLPQTAIYLIRAKI